MANTITFPPVSGGGGGGTGDATQGSITGVLNSQVDLRNVLNGKQATLVSGTNIKTINGQDVLGSGNIFITADIASPLFQPIITSPANGTVDYIGSITSTYTTSQSFVGVQDWVRWEAVS